MKFTQEQVLQAVKDYQDKDQNSRVIERWKELADEWLANADNDHYIIEGFVGLNDRPPEQVVLDFHLNDLLETPLTEQEFNDYLDKAKS